MHNNLSHAACRTTKLESLSLQQNYLKNIPDSFAALIKLRELRLDRNQISSLSNLMTLSNLRNLDISGNNIESLEVCMIYVFYMYISKYSFIINIIILVVI